MAKDRHKSFVARVFFFGSLDHHDSLMGVARHSQAVVREDRKNVRVILPTRGEGGHAGATAIAAVYA